MKIAVLGCGSIGSRHIRNLIALGVPASDILAIDRDPVALEKLPDGIVRFNGVHHSTEAVDARLICTPAKRHHLDIKDAIDDRVAFFVEKPATLGVSELTEAEWQTDVPHLVACNMRFRPEFRAMAQAAGDVCRLWVGCPSKDGDAGPVWENCHEIDVALTLFGPPVALQFGETSDLFMAVICERGTAFIGMSGGYYKRQWQREGEFYQTFLQWNEPPADVNQMYLDEMRHFLAIVRGDEKSINTLSQAKRVVEICEQAEQMASVSR